MASLIPLRPYAFASSLSQDEQSCLTWYVLSGCTRKEAFLLFVRPDMFASQSKPSVDGVIRQFFARKEVIDYVDAYKKTIDLFLHPPKVEKASTETLEERKSRAKTKLVEFAMSLADNIEMAEDKEFVLKIADKAGLLDMDEEIEEHPRRYLPVSCNVCKYKEFVEQNCEEVPDGTEIAE